MLGRVHLCFWRPWLSDGEFLSEAPPENARSSVWVRRFHLRVTLVGLRLHPKLLAGVMDGEAQTAYVEDAAEADVVECGCRCKVRAEGLSQVRRHQLQCAVDLGTRAGDGWSCSREADGMERLALGVIWSEKDERSCED